MARQTKKSEGLENTNDPYSNTKLAEMFERTDKQNWIRLTEMLTEGNYGMDELQLLNKLARIMKVSLCLSINGSRRYYKLLQITCRE